MVGLPVIDHCEDWSLKGDGVAHEGPVAAMLGLKGLASQAESVMVERDISMAELTGGHVHIAHMSAMESLRAVRAGKERGINVTAEVTPHHFVLTDEALRKNGGYDTNAKMNPPLREEADRLAMIEGLRDGSIEVIATDHAPHHADEKALEFDRAPFGIVGLETAVPLCLDRLVHAGVISLSRMVELLSTNPARVLNLPGGTIKEGEPADLTVLAPDRDVTIRAEQLVSKSKNTPFDGWTLKGAVAATIVGGKVVYTNGVTIG
jgi:dihydroorotase